MVKRKSAAGQEKQAKITSPIGNDKRSPPITEIIQLNPNDAIRFRNLIDGGEVVFGGVGAGKTKPPRKRAKKPQGTK
jgi:hypothetical protein